MYFSKYSDLKAENVLLKMNGQVLLTDFNLSLRMDKVSAATSDTGSRPYMGNLESHYSS